MALHHGHLHGEQVRAGARHIDPGKDRNCKSYVIRDTHIAITITICGLYSGAADEDDERMLPAAPERDFFHARVGGLIRGCGHQQGLGRA